MKYDAFVSHAWEDKEPFVEDLVEVLVSKGARIWYDKHSLRCGDGFRDAIDKGLSTSRFGIVVLSRAFFTKGWTKAELEGMAVEDARRLGDHILPIWHNVNADEVEQYSRILKGRVGIPSLLGVQKVSEELLLRIRPDLTEKLRDRVVPPDRSADMANNPYAPAIAITEESLARHLQKFDRERNWGEHTRALMSDYSELGIRYLDILDNMMEDRFCHEVLESLYDRILGRPTDSLGRATFLPIIYKFNHLGSRQVESRIRMSREYLEKGGV